MSSNSGLSYLDEHIHQELRVYMRLYVLLYADDTIILAESAKDLQLSLDRLKEYCDKWSLKVNVSKTKIVIFSRGKVRKYPTFKLGSSIIDVVDDYVYLGVTFNYNGSFRKAMDKQISQAKKAMFLLLQKVKILHLPLDIIIELFDVCVVPVLLYGSEIWGFENVANIDIFHRNFLRLLLNSYQFTPKCMLYGESNSIDMTTRINVKMISFWNKIRNSNTCKYSTRMCEFLSELRNKNDDTNFKWINKIRNILEETSLLSSWQSNSINMTLLKDSCNNIFLRRWKDEVNQNSQCSFYELIKPLPKIEKYMLDIRHSAKSNLLKFIMRNNHLPVTYNRFYEKYTYDDKCPLCKSGEVGNEIHYLFSCTFFNEERLLHLPGSIKQNYDIDNKLALSQLLTSSNDDLISLSFFVKIIMKYFRRFKKYNQSHKKTKLVS